MKKGEKKGMQKGEKKGMKIVAVKMLKKNHSAKAVAELTSLSIGEVEALKKKL